MRRTTASSTSLASQAGSDEITAPSRLALQLRGTSVDHERAGRAAGAPCRQLVLRAHRRRQATEQLRLGPVWGDRDLVFTREDGTALDPDWVTKRFERLAEAAGLPRIRLHDLRHGHATIALQAGIPVKIVSERLGHSTSAMTADTYQHVTPAMQEDAADKIAAVVAVEPVSIPPGIR